MRLLRLATVYLEPPSDPPIKGVKLESAQVSTLLSRELNGKLQLIVVAALSLQEKPFVTPERVVLVPDSPRQQAEFAIKAYADLIAVASRARRHIASPSPYVAFERETDDDWSWLEGAETLKAGFSARPGARPHISITQDIVDGMADRFDGLELCSEAQAQSTASGRFREFIRLFERAFSQRSKKQLVLSLSTFLLPNGQGYSEPEVRDWLVTKRHHLTHAGQRGPYLVESDIAPVIQRVEQAAYDVLLNKSNWRDGSPSRRNLWSPEVGTSDPGSSLFWTEGKEAALEFQAFDDLGGFPADLSAGLTAIPDAWWPRPEGMADSGPKSS